MEPLLGDNLPGITEMYLPITRWQILDSSELKDFAEDNFEFDKNGRQLSKPVENTVGKGEIASYEQFLLFPQCFQKACFPEASKGVIVWEWVNPFPNKQLFLPACSTSCSQQAISPFPTVFTTHLGNFLPFHQIWNCQLQTLSLWKSLNEAQRVISVFEGRKHCGRRTNCSFYFQKSLSFCVGTQDNVVRG